MSEQQISVQDLQEYWYYYGNLKEGDIIERHVGTSEMPAWHRICYDLNWRLFKADSGYFGKKHHGFCGVYRLIGLDSDDVRDTATIDRLGDKDTTGTLYIGEAGWLNERLNQLRRSLGREDTHGASRMWRHSQVLKSKFPTNRLSIALLGTSVRMHKKIESDMIQAYLNSFGDTPPLNCSY
jgi:hypothetical protein